MPEVEIAETAQATLNNEPIPDMQNIGVELEYPRLPPDAEDPMPASPAARSRGLRDRYGRGSGWLTSSSDDENGYMGSDHTGAEITSGILDLHGEMPETWYAASIEEAEEYGAGFAATGSGETNFGLHFHLSEMDEGQVEFIDNLCGEPWARAFFCASIDRNSVDPWRHGGVRTPETSSCFRQRRGQGHYEFRLPEPMLEEHFHLVMEFMRLVAHDEFGAAEDFASDLVYAKDERLTPVKQYQILEETLDDWPDNGALDGGPLTDSSAAHWFHDLMQSD